MSNLNTVAVSGNLTRDPELRHIPSGTAVCQLGIAVNRSVKDENADGGYREEVSFVDVTVWGNFGELCARKLRKADLVSVQGRLEQQRWETPEGDKRSKVIVVADRIDGEGFYRAKSEDNAGGSEPFTPAGATAAPGATAADDDIPF